MISKKDDVFHIEFAKSIYPEEALEKAIHMFRDAGKFSVGASERYPYYVVKFRLAKEYSDQEEIPYTFVNHVLSYLGEGNRK